MSQSPPVSPSSAPSWSPSPNDHLIFKWIKLEGKSQSFVASSFGISQPTVSRIIQRYERWQAHAADREDGRLDHTERLRAQRWLTYERNEIFLASCARMAKEMEGFTEVSKETVSRSTLRPDNPEKFRTETASVDRSGVAARFIRLAFRINMEQLKLVSLDPPPPALPLTADELAALDADARATAQEIEHSKNRADQQAQQFADAGYAPPAPFATPETADTYKPDPYAWPIPQPDPVGSPVPTTLAANSIHPPTLNLEPETLNSSSSLTPSPEGPPSSSTTPHNSTPFPALNLESGTLNSLPIHPVNNLNKEFTPQIAATPTQPTNYEFPPAPEKNLSCLNNEYPSDIPLAAC